MQEYRRSDAGKWVYVGGYRNQAAGRKEGDTWGEGDQQFRIERITRKEALEATGFDLVFEIMEAMAKHYGEEYVRLVVWFDG